MPIGLDEDSSGSDWPQDSLGWNASASVASSASSSPTKASSSASRSHYSPQWRETTGHPRSKPRKNVDKGRGRVNLAAMNELSSSEGEAGKARMLAGDTDVESAPSSASSSLFLDSRHDSWETQATQHSITTPQKKRSHEVEIESPHSVATPPPETPDSTGSSKVQRNPSQMPPIPRPNFGSNTLPKIKQGKGPKESSYLRGAISFPSANECDIFSPASSTVTPKPVNLSLKTESTISKPAGHRSTTHNAPSSEVPSPIRQLAPHTPIDLKPSLKILPPPIEHVINSPPDLEYIAHDDTAQMLFERRQLAWGVQWEIARGITDRRWKWDDVNAPEKLDKLKGENTEAAWKVDSVIREKQKSAPTLKEENEYLLWQELDREQKAINEGRGRGLGLLGDWQGVANWCGGQIQQVARLEVVEPSTSSSKTPSKISKKHSPSDPPRSFRIRLEKMENTRSFELARFFGSRRIVIVQVKDDLKGDDAREYLEKRFVICGRVFVPIQAKESSVYLVETNEDIRRTPNREQGDDSRMSLQEIVDWYNPMRYNYKQAISKWSTRWQLGLSTSVPAMEFEGKNIFFIGDEVAGTDPKPDARFVLTDGCGLMNGSAMSFLARRFNYPFRPAAVQGRIAGSKGLWILHPTDRSPDEPPRIWIRDSQRKVVHPPFDQIHRSHRIFNLVAVARVSTPHRLSKQALINLDHGGVPNEEFIELMRQALTDETRPLTDWDAPALVLWDAIYQAGGLRSSRLQIQARGLSRVLGVAGRKFREKIRADDTDVEDMLSDTDDTLGHQSNQPSTSIYENALQLVQSGFHPLHCKVLNRKLKTILDLVMQSCIKEYRFTLPLSAEAFIAPDPFGVLEEGEIFFQSSKPLKDPETDGYFHIFRGEVLILRYPIDQPHNVRKMVAVYRPELQEYYDVIFLSCRGGHSPANDLGGGGEYHVLNGFPRHLVTSISILYLKDYDGDDGIVTASRQIVQAFSNSEVILPPPDFTTENFQENIIMVQALITSDTPESQQTIRSQLLLGLAETCVGLYSAFHDISTYENGYGHEETRRLGWMFTTHLDAAKSGLRPRTEITQADRRKYFGKWLPICFEPVTQRTPQEISMKRSSKLKPFILDILLSEGRKLIEACLVDYEKRSTAHPNIVDKELCKPYEDARDRAEKAAEEGIDLLREELKRIKEHVDEFRERWPEVTADSQKSSGSISSRERNPKNDPFLLLARQFSAEPKDFRLFSPEEAQLVKASYAYKNNFKSGRLDTFAFCMALQSLCQIKARSQGCTSVTQTFGSCMAVPMSTVRVFSTAPRNL